MNRQLNWSTKGKRSLIIGTCLALCLTSATANAQKGGPFGLFKKKAPAADTVKPVKPVDKNGLKPYSEVITSAAITQKGVITVHRVKNDYFFEVPLRLMGRQFLVVNKLSKVAEKLNEAGVNKGMNFDNLVISFELDTALGKVFLRKDNPFYTAPAGDAIAASVADNFLPALIDNFKIEAWSKDSSAVVLKVNKTFDGTSSSLNKVFDALSLMSSADKELSRIVNMKSFENNLVIKSELTTKVTGVELSLEVTSNIVLLSPNPMTPRFSDTRVGFFSTPRWYFSDKQQELEKRELVTRWKLEPKASEREKYFRGELVEPEKPIIYYIDPATPPQWRTWIKKGIEDWQVAFEAAGFKNAIIAKDAPTNDPNFDPDNTSYSVVTYAASAQANAMGPSVVDPRSGEIIEADIIWWHNVMTIIQSWMRVQTGIIDPSARGNVFSDELMGSAIRFVSSHEVGHTLGLKHNMAASYSFPVDSLRSPSFTSRMGGTAPSIMDYARFNYIAQPGDGVTQITPVIGEYDKYAIAWAYRYLGKDDPREELKTLNEWILSKSNNPIYRYGEQQEMRNGIDPSAQSEDLGDDAMKAGKYGIMNLKRIMPLITKWTQEEGTSYRQAGRLYSAVVNQWYMYNYHVLTNVGGIYLNQVVFGENKDSYRHVEKEKQQRAVQYLINEAFKTPEWLFKDTLIRKAYLVKESPVGPMEYTSIAMLTGSQSYIYYDLLREERMNRMAENEAINGVKNAYTISELLNDLQHGVFATTLAHKLPDINDRNSQKGYVDALIVSIQKVTENSSSKKSDMLLPTSPLSVLCGHEHAAASGDRSFGDRNMVFNQVKRVSDGISAKRGALKRIMQLLQTAIPSTKDQMVKDHYADLVMRIKDALNEK
ncbi:zinc-dependent metalloprotease [Pseudoflavitalea sp. G-6-1-2]|uniref:zinc-dependent metalloprotease n=1 Tax=Pseudoflavitalea sp. G-6-1-2 TaxID=2728841 RepID=UPI00146D996C|nr:zinc-dependent metalloprotease [Pseudoflavitalea sp. G-6-1-2]NML19263.1 zinc-dependent metalloprotease [Pseudoflavitalea sp. G-6-1-2]